ncbi:MAG TPA: hypothetical protein VND22_09785 [Actinomycetota bacterium]|nr:hypothetical protein [Actinomycetota bacterium]
MNTRAALVAILVSLSILPPVASEASGPVGITFPPGFPTITDASLGVPVIGFGGRGPVTRTPVIFLHGNNDTPYPTTCNGGFGNTRRFAQYFHDNGYALSELWALGYQGEQCDLATNPPNRSGPAHSAAANVPDLRAFVNAVLSYTGASQVDIIGHSLGSTLTREWMRQDNAYAKVRRFIGVDGPDHGIINCSPDPANYWQLPALGGFTPDSAICTEFGSDQTPLLATLNAGDETPGPTEYMTVRNADTSFVFFSVQDGSLPPVPAKDRKGNAHDFSQSARLEGAENVEVRAQGQYDNVLLTAHLGILNSPGVWATAFRFLTAGESPASSPSVGPEPGTLADSGPPVWPQAAGVALLLLGLAAVRSIHRHNLTVAGHEMEA